MAGDSDIVLVGHPFVPIGMLFSAIASVVGLLDGAVHVPIAGTVATWLAGGAAWLVLWAIVWLGSTVASVPSAAVDVTVPPALAIAWFPMLAVATWAFRDPETVPAASIDETEPGAIARLVRRIARRVARPRH